MREFEARIARGERIEPGDWMPDDWSGAWITEPGRAELIAFGLAPPVHWGNVTLFFP